MSRLASGFLVRLAVLMLSLWPGHGTSELANVQSVVIHFAKGPEMYGTVDAAQPSVPFAIVVPTAPPQGDQLLLVEIPQRHRPTVVALDYGHQIPNPLDLEFKTDLIIVESCGQAAPPVLPESVPTVPAPSGDIQLTIRKGACTIRLDGWGRVGPETLESVVRSLP